VWSDIWDSIINPNYVMPREGGALNNHRPNGVNARGSEYWITRLRG
jgi:hypothetical protein